MASNFTSVFSIGEEVQFESLSTGKTVEGTVLAVIFYADETYYRVLIQRGEHDERVTDINQRQAKLVQKPLRERLIKQLSTMTDEEVEASPLFNEVLTVGVITDGKVES